MSILKFNVVAATTLLFVVSTGCNNPSSQSKEKVKVKIGMVTFPGYAPLYLAKEKGLFEGIDVELVRIESIGDLRAALRGGQIDAYAATYDIFQATKGVGPVGIGFIAIDESHGGDGVVVAKGINGLEDFRGKVVGAEPGFPPFFILQYLLHDAGMGLTDVKFKDISSQDAGNAFVAGQLDVAGTYEPYLSISESKREGAKIIYSSADMPSLIVDWLFASPKMVKDNPDALKKVAAGWFSALNYLEANPEESYEVMGAAFGVDAAEMKDFQTGITWLNLKDNEKMLDKSSSGNAFETFNKVGDILEHNGETDMRVKAEDHLTTKVITDGH